MDVHWSGCALINVFLFMYDPDTGFLGLLSLEATGFVFSFYKVIFSMDQPLSKSEKADSIYLVCMFLVGLCSRQL